MKVVVDTNVTVSGLLWHGPPNQILRWAKGGVLKILACQETIDELSRIIKYIRFNKRLSSLGFTTEEVISYFMNLVYFVPTPRAIPRKITVDPFDNLFLALASENGASLLISGDMHILSVKVYDQIQIVTPSEACQTIQKLFWILTILPDTPMQNLEKNQILHMVFRRTVFICLPTCRLNES